METKKTTSIWRLDGFEPFEVPSGSGGRVIHATPDGQSLRYLLPDGGYSMARGKLAVHGEAPVRIVIVNHGKELVEFYLMPGEPAEFTVPSPGGIFGFAVEPSCADVAVELLEISLMPSA